VEIWEYEFLEELLYNRRQKKNLEKELALLPKGNLVKRKRGENKWDYYINLNKNGKKREVYISRKTGAEIIENMKKATARRISIRNELIFLEDVFKRLQPLAIKIIETFTFVKNEYTATPSEKNDAYGNLKVLTTRGEMVRSKSERFIADTLYRYGIDYKYEKKLSLKEFNLHPDFTIVNPLDGRIYYWEHLGMNNSEYTVDWLNRKAVYNNNGLFEGKRLIVTTEEDTNRFDALVEEYFTIKRYDILLKNKEVAEKQQQK